MERRTGAPGAGALIKGALPFRLGTTSFIYRDDVLPNVRQLAARVDDVEIVIYEYNEQNPLPDGRVLAELQRVAAANDLTYTVHLPLDLALAAPDSARATVGGEGARGDGRDSLPAAVGVDGPCGTGAVHAGRVGGLATGGRRVAAATRRNGRRAGRRRPTGCVWRTWSPRRPSCPGSGRATRDRGVPGRRSPVQNGPRRGRPTWMPSLARTRVCPPARAGTARRTTSPWTALPPETLASVVKRLWQPPYAGVVTLEVFNEEDLLDSWRCLRDAWMPEPHSKSGEARHG